jgi:hypothetical protein
VGKLRKNYCNEDVAHVRILYELEYEVVSEALPVKLPVGENYPRPGDGVNASLMCYALELRKLEGPLRH